MEDGDITVLQTKQNKKGGSTTAQEKDTQEKDNQEREVWTKILKGNGPKDMDLLDCMLATETRESVVENIEDWVEGLSLEENEALRKQGEIYIIKYKKNNSKNGKNKKEGDLNDRNLKEFLIKEYSDYLESEHDNNNEELNALEKEHENLKLDRKPDKELLDTKHETKVKIKEFEKTIKTENRVSQLEKTVGDILILEDIEPKGKNDTEDKKNKEEPTSKKNKNLNKSLLKRLFEKQTQHPATSKFLLACGILMALDRVKSEKLNEKKRLKDLSYIYDLQGADTAFHLGNKISMGHNEYLELLELIFIPEVTPPLVSTEKRLDALEQCLKEYTQPTKKLRRFEELSSKKKLSKEENIEYEKLSEESEDLKKSAHKKVEELSKKREKIHKYVKLYEKLAYSKIPSDSKTSLEEQKEISDIQKEFFEENKTILQNAKVVLQDRIINIKNDKNREKEFWLTLIKMKELYEKGIANDLDQDQNIKGLKETIQNVKNIFEFLKIKNEENTNLSIREEIQKNIGLLESISDIDIFSKEIEKVSQSIICSNLDNPEKDEMQEALLPMQIKALKVWGKELLAKESPHEEAYSFLKIIDSTSWNIPESNVRKSEMLEVLLPLQVEVFKVWEKRLLTKESPQEETYSILIMINNTSWNIKQSNFDDVRKSEMQKPLLSMQEDILIEVKERLLVEISQKKGVASFLTMIKTSVLNMIILKRMQEAAALKRRKEQKGVISFLEMIRNASSNISMSKLDDDKKCQKQETLFSMQEDLLEKIKEKLLEEGSPKEEVSSFLEMIDKAILTIELSKLNTDRKHQMQELFLFMQEDVLNIMKKRLLKERSSQEKVSSFLEMKNEACLNIKRSELDDDMKRQRQETLFYMQEYLLKKIEEKILEEKGQKKGGASFSIIIKTGVLNRLIPKRMQEAAILKKRKEQKGVTSFLEMIKKAVKSINDSDLDSQRKSEMLEALFSMQLKLMKAWEEKLSNEWYQEETDSFIEMIRIAVHNIKDSHLLPQKKSEMQEALFSIQLKLMRVWEEKLSNEWSQEKTDSFLKIMCRVSWDIGICILNDKRKSEMLETLFLIQETTMESNKKNLLVEGSCQETGSFLKMLNKGIRNIKVSGLNVNTKRQMQETLLSMQEDLLKEMKEKALAKGSSQEEVGSFLEMIETAIININTSNLDIPRKAKMLEALFLIQEAVLESNKERLLAEGRSQEETNSFLEMVDKASGYINNSNLDDNRKFEMQETLAEMKDLSPKTQSINQEQSTVENNLSAFRNPINSSKNNIITGQNQMFSASVRNRKSISSLRF